MGEIVEAGRAEGREAGRKGVGAAAWSRGSRAGIVGRPRSSECTHSTEDAPPLINGPAATRRARVRSLQALARPRLCVAMAQGAPPPCNDAAGVARQLKTRGPPDLRRGPPRCVQSASAAQCRCVSRTPRRVPPESSSECPHFNKASDPGPTHLTSCEAQRAWCRHLAAQCSARHRPKKNGRASVTHSIESLTHATKSPCSRTARGPHRQCPQLMARRHLSRTRKKEASRGGQDAVHDTVSAAEAATESTQGRERKEDSARAVREDANRVRPGKTEEN